MEQLRSAWLQGVVRECQVLAGKVLPGRSRALRPLFEAFVGRLPEPRRQVERVVLRGLLLETAIRWGDDHHDLFHRRVGDARCSLVTSDIAARHWRRSALGAKDIFRRWAADYARAFNEAHPLHCAFEARDAIDARFAEGLRLSVLADDSGVPPRRLQRRFLALTGTTVHAYLTHRRIEAAITLLQQTHDKVEAIARQVGWSRTDLNRALAREHGLTPGKVRQPSPET